jgi:hypothetical protein
MSQTRRLAAILAVDVAAAMAGYSGQRRCHRKASPLFRTAAGKIGKPTERRMHRTDVLRMIWRRGHEAQRDRFGQKCGGGPERAESVTVF